MKHSQEKNNHHFYSLYFEEYFVYLQLSMTNQQI